MRDIKINLDDAVWVVEYLAESAVYDSTYDKWTQGGRVSVSNIEDDPESHAFVSEFVGYRKWSPDDALYGLGKLLSDMSAARLLDAERTRIAGDRLMYRYEFRLRFDVLQDVKESQDIRDTVEDIIPKGWVSDRN